MIYLRNNLLWLLMLLAADSSSAQNNDIFRLNELPKEEILLSGWKMYAGDDPGFAVPTFNDSHWQPVDLSKDLQQLPEFIQAGIIWARLHISMDSAVARQQLAAYIIHYSASEIYLNGRLLKKYGIIDKDPVKTRAYLPSPLPFDLSLEPGMDNVLAVRLAYQKGLPYISYLNVPLPALNFYINNKESAAEKYLADQWQTKMYIIIFSISSGTLLIIGFIYLVFFLFDRRQKPHLYYAIAMLTQCLNALPVEVWGTDRYGGIERLMWVFYLEAVAYSISLLFIVLTVYAIFMYPYRLMVKLLLAITIGLVAGMYFYGTTGFFLISYILPAAYLLAAAYACIWAIRQKKKNAGIILAGVLLFAFSSLLSVLIPVNIVSSQLLFYMTQMCFPIGMSFYFGIQNALTNNSLRTSLEEVQMLSARNLEQEQEKQLLLSNQNILLEQQVEERTAALNQSLTDLKSAQAQLIQSEKMASLGELTAGIAHEIQNPLNFVNNFSEINLELIQEVKSQKSTLKTEELDELLDDIAANQEKINHHGKRADAIVKGMLQHSQSGKGQKELTDLNALCDEYLRLSYHGLRAKDKSFNATLKTDFDPSIGKINIVPQDIGRVIMNLLTNAFYAINEKAQHATRNTQPGTTYEPTVSLSTKKTGDKIEITVSDNGNGIPQHIIDKIFQPFFTTKPTGQGTGLGLSLSYDIIRAHGGTLKVESGESEGSLFIVELPQEKALSNTA